MMSKDENVTRGSRFFMIVTVGLVIVNAVNLILHMGGRGVVVPLYLFGASVLVAFVLSQVAARIDNSDRNN